MDVPDELTIFEGNSIIFLVSVQDDLAAITLPGRGMIPQHRYFRVVLSSQSNVQLGAHTKPSEWVYNIFLTCPNCIDPSVTKHNEFLGVIKVDKDEIIVEEDIYAVHSLNSPDFERTIQSIKRILIPLTKGLDW